MRITTAAWFLPVSLAAILATVTNVSVLAYQAPGSPPADGSQVPGPPGPSASSQPSNAATPPAAPASIRPRSPARSGPVQQVYSTAWPYLDFTPTGRSAYGGTGSAAANVPLPPTGRAGVNRYPTPSGARGGGSSFTSQAAAGGMSGPARTGASSKPFSSYSRRSGVSPYMNLFRTDNYLTGVDNYNMLVKPKLEQRKLNRQTQWDVQSLRSKSGVQGTQLRELNRRTNTLQGTSLPSRFKNTYDYYPGLKR